MTDMRLPRYSLIGLAIVAVSETAMFLQIDPFWTWHTPIAWTGYLLFVDGVVWSRRGAAMLLWPIVQPSPYLAAPVWLGFIFLLDPINARLGVNRVVSDRMGPMATILEREIKLGFRDAAEARRAILATGATPLRARRLQEDCLLDTIDDQLRRRRCVLRLRMDGGKSFLTFKGPVQSSPMKLREELETVIGDGLLVLRVLEELGFRVWFRYQKYREEFAHEDVTVALDETPVGIFVEIEGSELGITKTAEALARTPDDYLLDSYRNLFVKHCERQGLAVTDMLFEEP